MEGKLHLPRLWEVAANGMSGISCFKASNQALPLQRQTVAAATKCDQEVMFTQCTCASYSLGTYLFCSRGYLVFLLAGFYLFAFFRTERRVVHSQTVELLAEVVIVVVVFLK